MDLKPGHDYHLAEARSAGLGRYVATCNGCGWSGPTRDTRRAADDDAAAHDIAENDEPHS
jgi:hypothetical protein